MTCKKPIGLLTVLFIACTTSVFGQADPPSAAMPTDSNTILVDQIIKVTKHEAYFIDYCTEKVKTYAANNKWKPEKTAQILKSINFEYYSSTIYNSYAFFTTDQLKALLNAFVKLNKDPKISLPMVLTNSMMQSNLDSFIDNLVNGKYLTTN